MTHDRTITYERSLMPYDPSLIKNVAMDQISIETLQDLGEAVAKHAGLT